MAYKTINVNQMIDIDRVAIDEYGISLLQMMENAGRSLAELSRAKLGGEAAGTIITVLAGRGNNGGGGFVAARHLANAGADVRVVIAADRSRFDGVPSQQLRTLELMDIELIQADDDVGLHRAIASADLLIDALVGYSLRGRPSEDLAMLIRSANAADGVRISLDTPSGLDSDTGTAYDPTIQATATLTLAWPKSGTLTPEASPYIGELWLADIGIHTAVLRTLGFDAGFLFSLGPVFRVRGLGGGRWEPESQ